MIFRSVEGDFHGVGKKGHANVQMARILQYLECPQYLRKSFFPQHKDLQYAGKFNIGKVDLVVIDTSNPPSFQL